MSEASEERRQTRLINRIIRNTSDLIVNSLRLADRNADGRLSAEEGASLISVSVVESAASPETTPAQPPTTGMQILPNYEAPASSSIVDDSIVSNRSVMITALSQKYELPPERIEGLINRAFPNGVAPVTMGTLCSIHPELQCLPLPNGKIIRFNGPAVTS